jgi:RNA polymerase sigma-70 factor (ECF subfamily)
MDMSAAPSGKGGSGRSSLERDLQAHCQGGRYQDALELALRGYRGEIQSWLASVLRDRDAANDVFSAFCEDLWQGIATFRWECSFRTWAYCLARNAVRRWQRSRGRMVYLGDRRELRLVQEARSLTEPWLRTEIKSGFARLRERLDPADSMLLTLRVDRQMAWDEVARILTDDPAPTTDAVRRRAAALRQQFQRLKARLRELARAQGLICEEE